MDLRPTLSRLRKLIATRDPSEIEQAVEIALSLDDPALYDALLGGVGFAMKSHRGQTIGVITPGEFFGADTRPAQRFNDHALRLLLARIPESHARAAGIRDAVTALTLHADEPYPYLPLDLSPIAAFKNLRRVELRGVSSVTHLSVLADLPHLEELHLRSGTITQGLEGLERSTSLRSVYIQCSMPHIGDLGEGPLLHTLEIPWGSNLTDLHGIESLKALEKVIISSGTHIRSLAAFAKITTLKSATLSSFNNIEMTSLAGLEASADLEYLSFTGSITSLDALRGHKRLKSLVLNGCSKLTSIAGLSGCSTLEGVSLGHTAITSLDGLEHSDLKSLDVNWCSALADVHGLRGTTQLTHVQWSRMNALKTLAGMENLRRLTHLELDNPHALTSIAALREVPTITNVMLANAFALTSLDGLQGSRGLAQLTITEARALTDLSALGDHPALKNVVISHAPLLTDVTPLARLTGLETLDLSHAKLVTDVNALAALPNLKALGLGQTGVDRATLDPKLKKITSFAMAPDLAAMAARGPLERHGPHVPEAVTKDLKKSYTRLKRLLLARDVTLVEQGVELAATLDEKGIFEGLLEGVTYSRALRRSRAGFSPPHTPGGMFAATGALEATAPGAPYRDRAILGLLARAPADCAPANALREAVTALELDGETGRGKFIPMSLAPLGVFPKLTELTVTTASEVEDFDRVASLTALTSLAFMYCSPEDLSPLKDHPTLTYLSVQHHWHSPRVALKGLSQMPALTSLTITGGAQPGSETVGDMPALDILRLQQIRQLESLRVRRCPKLLTLELSNFDTLDALEIEDCDALATFRMNYIPKLAAVRGLGRLARLKVLSITNPQKLPFEARDVEGLTGLTQLLIASCNTLTELSALAPLTSLETLTVNYCGNLSDITALRALPNLTHLTLEGCTKVADVATLEALPKLRQLNVKRTMIDKTRLPAALKRIAR